MRQSKFRHVYGVGAKKELCFDGPQVSMDSNDWHLVKGNQEYLSIHWDSANGGSFLLHPLRKACGKLDYRPKNLCIGHNGSVLDTEFSPFAINVIASAGEDARILLWKIPEEGPIEGQKWEAEFSGHKRRIIDLAWNPSVSTLLSSASHDSTVCLWDINSNNQPLTVLTGHQDAVLDQSWSLQGDRLVTGCRDKTVRIFDPRKGSTAATEIHTAHVGIRGIRVVWLGETDHVISTGFGSSSEREISLWDSRTCREPLVKIQLDPASGALLPFYDSDLCILYVGGRGEGTIKYYEFTSEDRGLHFLNEYRSAEPQRGLALLPKSVVSVTECEISRFIKVHGNQPLLEPISFRVPRRETVSGFPSDIYPETLAPEPSVSTKEYMEGITRPPRKTSLQTLQLRKAPCLCPKKEIAVSEPPVARTKATPINTNELGELKTALTDALSQIENLRRDLDEKASRIRQLEAELAAKIFNYN